MSLHNVHGAQVSYGLLPITLVQWMDVLVIEDKISLNYGRTDCRHARRSYERHERRFAGTGTLVLKSALLPCVEENSMLNQKRRNFTSSTVRLKKMVQTSGQD